MVQPGGIRIERTFRASPEKVWRMWTTAEGLNLWFAPAPWTADFSHVDARVGGAYEGDFHHGDETIHNHGTYTEVVPNKLLAWRDQFDMLADIEPYDTHGRLVLERAGTGTKMTFTHTPLHSPEWTQNAATGWTQTLAQLAKALGE